VLVHILICSQLNSIICALSVLLNFCPLYRLPQLEHPRL